MFAFCEAENATVRVLRKQVFFAVILFQHRVITQTIYIFPIMACENFIVFLPDAVSLPFLLLPLVLGLQLQNLFPEESDIMVKTKTATLRTISIISVHQTMRIYTNISKYQMKIQRLVLSYC